MSKQTAAKCWLAERWSWKKHDTNPPVNHISGAFKSKCLPAPVNVHVYAQAQICWLISHWKLEGNVGLCAISWWPVLRFLSRVTFCARPSTMNEAIHGRWTVDSAALWLAPPPAFANDFPAVLSQGRNLSKPKLVNLSTEKWHADTSWWKVTAHFCGDGAWPPSSGRRMQLRPLTNWMPVLT